MLKQAGRLQEQMQKNIQERQATLAARELEGSSGAGLVRVVMTGLYDVRSVRLDDEVLREDKAFLEDLLTAAFNDAVRKVTRLQEETSAAGLAGVLPQGMFPPGFKL